MCVGGVSVDVCVGGVLAGVLGKVSLCLYCGLVYRDDCVDAYVAV